jgi:hypothetical protein
MAMNEQRGSKHVPAVAPKRFRPRYWVLALAMVACGGSLGKRTAGGESHFLEVCAESCSEGLECITGVCTRSCLVESPDCKDLSPRAVCTNQSIEPGAVAVCDVGCARARDCTGLGDDFECRAGFCRAGTLPDPPSNVGGAGGGPGFEPFNDDHCESPGEVQSTCSFEATCAELHCGDGFSQFGADGCTRRCASDADCENGERCRYTALDVSSGDCPTIGSVVEGCELFDGECSCSISADCQRPNICVDAQAYPESQDCVVEGASCELLAEVRWRIAPLAEGERGPDLAVKAGACLSAVDAERLELSCASEPNEQFAPACASPLEFESSCSFAATCAQLGCGGGLSQFDSRGCTRYCEASTDCGQGERCRHTWLVLSDEECPSPGSEVEGCSMIDGECECGITADCVHPDICVDAAAYPASQDCAVDEASCQALSFGESRLQQLLEADSTPADAVEAQSCLEAIRAKQQALACAQ